MKAPPSRIAVVERTLAIAIASIVLAGCSQGTESPAGVVEDFESALDRGDYAAACELLTPRAKSKLESDGGGSCAETLATVGVPAGGAVVEVEAWGRGAIADLEQDTLFLARTGESWAVRAAGCTPVTGAPYDCVVTGD